MINGNAVSNFKCPCECAYELTCEPYEILNGSHTGTTGNKLSVEAREHLRKHIIKDSSGLVHGLRKEIGGYDITKQNMLYNAIKIICDGSSATDAFQDGSVKSLKRGEAKAYYESLTVKRIGKVVLGDLASALGLSD